MGHFSLSVKTELTIYFSDDTPQFNGHRNYVVQAETLEKARSILFPKVLSFVDTNSRDLFEEKIDFGAAPLSKIIEDLKLSDFNANDFENLNVCQISDSEQSCLLTINDPDSFGYERVFITDSDLVELTDQEYALLTKHSDLVVIEA